MEAAQLHSFFSLVVPLQKLRPVLAVNSLLFQPVKSKIPAEKTKIGDEVSKHLKKHPNSRLNTQISASRWRFRLARVAMQPAPLVARINDEAHL